MPSPAVRAIASTLLALASVAGCSETLGSRSDAALDAPAIRDALPDSRRADDAAGACVGAACDAGSPSDAGDAGDLADARAPDDATSPVDAADVVDACATCTTCGNGACEPGETCGSCASDCGACPPACGDGTCGGGETCGVCLDDCRAACPSPPAGFGVGDGLSPIAPCAFPMQDTNTWASRGAVISALAGVLPVRTVTDVLGDLNRTGTRVTSIPGLSSITNGVRWETGDENVTYWIPQGITGSGDAVAGTIGGRRVVLVSWYYEGAAPDKGVRIAFLDVTSIATPTYRFALLVEPFMNGTRPDFRAVNVHAGGLAWIGDLLYVPDTGNGFRVFDMSHVFEVATGTDTIGYSGGSYYAHQYKYVIPQIGAYQEVSRCNPLYSFTALDRATTPPSLVSGEYVSGSPVGRLFRWALDPATHHLAGGTYVIPSEAFYSGQDNIQGAVPAYGHWLLSSSAPAGGAGALYSVDPGASRTFGWSDAPEDLYVDVGTGQLWSLSEAVGARYVFSRAVTNYR